MRTHLWWVKSAPAHQIDLEGLAKLHVIVVMGQCWFPAAIWLVNLIFRGVVYDLMVAGGVVQSIVDKDFKPLSVKHD